MDQNQPFCLDAAWERLCKWALFLMNMLGAPAALARLTVSAAAHEDIAARLKPLEIGLRRALLIEALALPDAEAPAPSARAAPVALAIKRGAKAGISFRLTRPSRAGARSRRFAFRERPSHFSAAPLARRYEAALRVIKNRRLYVLRLAALIRDTQVQSRPYRAPSPYAHALLTGLERALGPLVARHNLRRADLCSASARRADDG